MFRSLESALERANTEVPKVVELLASEARVDVTQVADGAIALLLARAAKLKERPCVVVTSNLEEAVRTCADLRFFFGADDTSSRVLLYPSADTSPYLDVAPDRRAAMDRLACLAHLSQGLPWDAMVLPIGALLRKAPPLSAIVSRSKVVRPGEEVDRDELIALLSEGGYLRVPVAEDPGTFAVRGGILDIFPPHARVPVRLELDDWLVLSTKEFDPDDQRTLRELSEVFIHPVRESLLGAKELARARRKIRDACDEVNMPTKQVRALIDDLESGRTFYGLEGLLPGFFSSLENIFSYTHRAECNAIPRIALLDPPALQIALRTELERAASDLEAKRAESKPTFAIEEHYLSEDSLVSELVQGPLLLVHRVGAVGESGEEEGPFAHLTSTEEHQLLRLGG
ncbi:MAG: hypothetical protein AAF550_03070, partial [Myxococcota bacterium]